MNTLRRLATGAAVAGAVMLPASTAFAAGTTNTSGSSTTTASSGSSAASGSSSSADKWQEAHAKLLEALSDRVTTLSQLSNSVEENKYLTRQDRSTLQSLLGPETTGINNLYATVKAATQQNTTLQQLRQDASTMVHQYRVYLVMSRQVHETEAACTQTSVETRISNLEPKLQAEIQKDGNPPDAVKAYNDLVTQVKNAATATGNADIPAVLQVSPPGYPSDGGPLFDASTALHTADTDLTAARGDLQIIRNVLTQHDGTMQGGSSASG